MVTRVRLPTPWPLELSLQSLRGRLAALLGLAFLPAGAVAVQAGMTAEAERRVAIQQAIGADELATLNAARDEIIQMREITRSLAANADLFADNRARCQETLENIGREYPEDVVLSVLDADSNVLCADQRALVGSQPQLKTLLVRAAATNRTAIDFLRSDEPAFAAVAPAQMRPIDQELFVSVTRLAGPLLNNALTSELDTYTLVTDPNGAPLLTRGLDFETEHARRVRALLEQTPPPLLTNAVRVGDRWVIAAPIEPERLYFVHGWAPPPPTWLERARSAWTLLSPLLLWLAAVAAAWYAIEIFVARPLFIVERLARAYARGEESEDDEVMLRSAPAEIRNLRRTLAAMAKTLRGREARITEALQEERVLLREVHHRVKNNLQMVASILSIQARAASEEAEARGLGRARDRVQMLALAHARIYASGEVRGVALDQLAGDIARQLISGRGAAAAHLRLDMHLDPVRTDVDRAVAFAFLIGEGLSNAIDLALAGGGRVIHLALRVERDGSLTLEVACPDVVEDTPPAPAAQRLVDAFAAQLGARVMREPGKVSTRIVVPPETEAETVGAG